MLIKSVGVTFSILGAFVGRRCALTLKEIAYRSGLPASKAHRYLQSLIREGMITQDPRTRLYRLGTTAIALGLEALENTDPVVTACETVRPLAERHDVGISIDVLGPNGPICIWYEQPATPLPVPVRIGAAQPLLASAAGHVFLAYLPRHVTRELATEEARHLQDGELDPDTLAYSVKSEGFASVPALRGAGAASLAAPVLDARGEACASITFFTLDRQDDQDARERRIVALLSAANEASAFRNFRRRQLVSEAV